MKDHLPHPLPEIMDVDQCAELLRCTAERVEEMARGGEIPSLKIGRSWIFVYPDLLHFLAEKARAEAESRRMKRSPHAPLPQGKPRRQVPPTLPVPTLGTSKSAWADAKPPASTASDVEQVIEEYFHAGMKIEIFRDAGKGRRPTYFAVIINPLSKTRSGTLVEASSYGELLAAVEVRAEQRALQWQRRQERDAAQTGPSS